MTDTTVTDTDTLEFRGGWLTAARAIWIAITLVLIAGLIYSFGDYFNQLRSLTGVALRIDFGAEWKATDLRAVLDQTGISPTAYGIALASAALLPKVVFFSVALIIFMRSSRQWMGWYTSLMLVLMGLAFGPITTAPSLTNPFWGRFIDPFANVLAWTSFYAFLFIFPGGRLVPRWTWVIVILLVTVTPTIVATSNFNTNPVAGVLILFFFGTGVYSQIYRYRNISGPIERLQTRWLIASTAVLGVMIILTAFVLPSSFVALEQPGPTKLYYQLLRIPIQALGLSLVPITLGIAILRYRLWDIDLIIRRTLIYTSITLVLGLVYFGGVVGMQALFSGVTGGESPLAVVATTLLIAALFAPLRRRVQDFVDRRFYRRKYDLTRTVDAFASTLYEAVDIEHLSTSLITVVDKTMKPQHISLWVNEPDGQQSRSHG